MIRKGLRLQLIAFTLSNNDALLLRTSSTRIDHFATLLTYLATGCPGCICSWIKYLFHSNLHR